MATVQIYDVTTREPVNVERDVLCGNETFRNHTFIKRVFKTYENSNMATVRNILVSLR
jgi:hypothetical protein